MSNNSVRVEPGFRGTVTGLTRASYDQRATITVQNAARRTLASTTLVGKGENSSMTQEVNKALSAWAFGPFDEAMTINVSIEFASSGKEFRPSKAILPVTVTKNPDGSCPQTYVISTLLSEDGSDNDFNDCIISIFQYKEATGNNACGCGGRPGNTACGCGGRPGNTVCGCGGKPENTACGCGGNTRPPPSGGKC
ncbi:hypothetical protein LshimejAT787_0703620 [Lyophyllum shimeji]|uniref:Uncharacterized protein n=1 Tax=Lyophyllum shimeji TaxID=47721 RepID=A0A9P3UP05_LYOSH|nr:hypothetical protein LshimejAT787_0703620 [Lyophyllum shimeji]